MNKNLNNSFPLHVLCVIYQLYFVLFFFPLLGVKETHGKSLFPTKYQYSNSLIGLALPLGLNCCRCNSNSPYAYKQALANLAKDQAIALQVKGIVIALVITQKHIPNLLLWLTPVACSG